MAAVIPAPGLVQVKQEKPDDPEIVEMAAKIAEANRIKLAQTNAQAANAQPRTLNGAANLRGYIVATGTAGGVVKPVGAIPLPSDVKTETKKPDVEVAIDEPSTRGKFSWTVIGSTSVPVILRRDGKYISVRIMEMKVLSTFLNFLHPDIYLQARVPSYAMTDNEHRLMNEINLRHCESKFGRESFSSRDLVVRLHDAIDFYKFLDVCYHKLNGGGTNHGIDKCGFIRINNDSVIPFTVKDGERYVPIFYFEGETDKLKTKSVELSGWELAYLKFCCKVQGIKNELFNNETCAVTSLQDIKSYFNTSDVFEEYWPKKVIDSQLLISANKNAVTGSNSWIRTPPPGPHSKHPGGVVKNNGVIAVNGAPSGAGLVSAWNGAQPGVARGPANIQQQLAAASRNAAAVAQAAARGAAVAGARGMSHQYYTSQGGVPSLVRPGAAQSQQTPAHPPSGANMTAAYAKVISNSYTNLTPAGAYKNGWPNGYTPANAQQIQQMIASGQIPAASYSSYQTSAPPPPPPGAKTLAPPPLIPVMNSAAARSQQQQQQQRYLQAANAAAAGNTKASVASNAEIIDLSSPPNSPQARSRAAAQVNGRGAPNGAGSTGLGNFMHALYTRYDRAIIDSFQIISEIHNPGPTKPYRISKARIQDTVLTCINRQAFMYNEDLMTTISDFIGTMAPNVHPRRVIEAFNVLSIKLYVPNRLQVLALNETKRYKDLCMIIPLISVVDIKEHSGAISYVLSPESNASRGGSGPKRARMS